MRALLIVALYAAVGALIGCAIGGLLNTFALPHLTTTERGVLCVMLALLYAVWLGCRRDKW